MVKELINSLFDKYGKKETICGLTTLIIIILIIITIVYANYSMTSDTAENFANSTEDEVVNMSIPNDYQISEDSSENNDYEPTYSFSSDFDMYDKNNNGYLSYKEYYNLYMNNHPSGIGLDYIFSEIDTDYDGVISRSEYNVGKYMID